MPMPIETPGDRGAYRWWLAGFLFFSSALNYGDRTAITALFPLLQKELGLTDLGLAAVGSAFLWSYAFCSPFAGMIADRFARGRLVVLSLLGWSLVTAGTGLVHSPWALWTMRGALGVVESLYIPAAVALLAAHHGVQTRGKAIGIHIAGLSVGMVAGGTISGYLAAHYGWRVPLLALGGVGVFVAAIGYFIIRDEEAEPREGAARPPAGESFVELAKALRNPAVLVLFFEIMFMGTGVWSLINWLPLYFSETFSMSLGKAALFGSLFLQAGATLGVLAGGWPSDHAARRGIPGARMELFGRFYMAAAPLMLIFLLAPSAGAIAVSVFVYGLLRGMGSLNSNPLICEMLPPHARSTALGCMNMLACLAGGMGVMVAGALKQRLGLAGVFASITFVTAICGGLLLLSAWHIRHSATAAEREESLGCVAAIDGEGSAGDVG